jgi:aspartyl-tRNA(Asn)/glutamyl-tRNA(Gln) amidotransferase subunit A
MARCVLDAALLLQTIADYDPHDPYCVNTPLDDYLGGIADGVRGWRIALAADGYFQDVDAGIWQVIESAAGLFADLGAQVERVEIPNFTEFARANSLLVTADAAAVYHQPLAERPQDFGADVLERLRSGAAHPLVEYIQARRLQAEAVRQFDHLFSQFDLLLLPASPVLAPSIQQTQAVQRARQLTRFTSVFNFTGLPAISLPGGFIEKQGLLLPVGLQLVARPWAEARLLRGAYAYEQAAGWFRTHPALDADSL